MNSKRAYGTITVDGTDYPVKFGSNQTAIFCDLEGWEMKEYNDLLTPQQEEGKEGKRSKLMNLQISGTVLRSLVYSALKDGARVAGQSFHLTPEDVGDLIDDMAADVAEGKPKPFEQFFIIMSGGNDTIPNEKGAAKAPGKTKQIATAKAA